MIFRSLLRDWLNTLVIIVSLSVGIACVNLVILFLSRELGTDNFHSYKDRIYALKCDDPWIPGARMYHCRFGSAEYMKNNFSRVEDLCRINNASTQKIIAGNEDYFDRPPIIAASENFFRFFSYNLLTGNPATALETSNNLVISSGLAGKYFGPDNPVGKIIILVNGDRREEMAVSGVFEKPSDNTQINFEMVRLIGNADSRCYLRLADNADPQDLENLFEEQKASIPVIHTGTPGRYYLEPLIEAYFNTARGSSVEISRDKRDLWIAFLTGLIIIGVAVFNYLGILTNRHYRKIKEYYIRRINGGSLLNLITRFMLENSIVVFVSFLISIFIMFDALKFFNSLTGSNITSEFVFRPEQLLILIVFMLFLIMITLLFAFYLIRSNLDLHLLKTGQNFTVRSIQIPAFNIFQLSGSIALLICSMIIIRQMNYISNKPIGLNKDVIEIKIPAQLKDKAGVIRDELMKNSSVKNVSVAGASPVLEHFLVALKYQDNGTEKQYSPAGFSGDENYLDVLGIDLIAGTGFSGALSPSSNKCLVNESFAELFPDRDLIGKGMPGMEEMIITGIVKDFHYSGLQSKVEPAFISFNNQGGHLLVKATESQTQAVINIISKIWQKLVPEYPVNLESVEDRFEWFHRKNKNFIKLIGSCAFISLFLSMIGIFAISYQKTRSRTKEIGIRKINGANIYGILTLLNRDFIKWTAIAFTGAVPAAWFAMSKWLENYAYKTELEWWIFFLSGIIVLGITLLTVSLQSLIVVTKNPVEALRYE
jgi:putative ABC transport system permease protein